MRLQFDAGFVFKLLLLCILVLVLAHLLGVVSRFYFHHDHLMGLVPLFNLDGEGNVPAVFSGAMLILSACLLLLITRGRREAGQPWMLWLLLAGIFAFLAVDELLVLHERLGYAVGDALRFDGLLHEYAWVLPYGIAVLVLGVLYLRFLLRLPARPRILMVVGGVCYVVGAIGIELAGSGLWRLEAGAQGWQYYLMVALEEGLEMLGIVVFIYALLVFISDHPSALSWPKVD